jgi:hypothetical protein
MLSTSLPLKWSYACVNILICLFFTGNNYHHYIGNVKDVIEGEQRCSFGQRHVFIIKAKHFYKAIKSDCFLLRALPANVRTILRAIMMS